MTCTHLLCAAVTQFVQTYGEDPDPGHALSSPYGSSSAQLDPDRIANNISTCDGDGGGGGDGGDGGGGGGGGGGGDGGGIAYMYEIIALYEPIRTPLS